MKFGFDVHGVVDTHCDIYATITAALVAAGHEVHVITGAVMSHELEGILKESGVTYTNFFSIAQYHMDKGDNEVKWVDGEPWMDDEVWNRTKADYCLITTLDDEVADDSVPQQPVVETVLGQHREDRDERYE